VRIKFDNTSVEVEASIGARRQDWGPAGAETPCFGGVIAEVIPNLTPSSNHSKPQLQDDSHNEPFRYHFD